MIPPDSVFIGHGYLQRAGAEWLGKHCLRYYVYLIPKDLLRLDDIAFAYGSGLSIEADCEDDDDANVEEEVPQDRSSRYDNDAYKVHVTAIPDDDYLGTCGLFFS